MAKRFHEFGLRVIDGRDRSLLGRITRVATSVVEPFYATAMRLRNSAFDRGLKRVHDLGRPTVSVGNITTGGTGKTPVVVWLADRLRERGHRPAILLRGYGATRPGSSDEQQLLDAALNTPGLRPIPVHANPSRVEAAASALRLDPSITVFILDDAFQHRRARRDFDLVLVNAAQPFGYDHVLPRGLLREPMSGLSRASAFLLTHCSEQSNSSIEKTVRKFNTATPLFRSDHVQTGVWEPRTDRHVPLENLTGKKVFLLAGIGEPESFASQLASAGFDVVGSRWFVDHHPYTSRDLQQVRDEAAKTGATWLLTTQKDWVKLRTLARADLSPPLGVVDLSILMSTADETALLGLIEQAIQTSRR